MKLTWMGSYGPSTTQELADEVEREGRLIKGIYQNAKGERCLWGVIRDYRERIATRHLTLDCERALIAAQLSMFHVDRLPGTPENICREVVRRLRALP